MSFYEYGGSQERMMYSAPAKGLVSATLVFLASALDPVARADSQFPPAIEDNSFLIEEAYNQESRVVQHISTFAYFKTPVKSLAYNFTQEWPVGSQRHQFSYSIPYTFQGEGLGSGLGDLLINYRYQLAGREAPVTLAPRLSLVLATGDEGKGLGSGAHGLQFNLPMSKRLSDRLVVHGNAGATALFGATSSTDTGPTGKATLWTYNVGGSAIWLVTPSFNMVLEMLGIFSDDFDESGRVVNSTETIINPGLRYAIDVGSLQIVPGLAIPISHTPEETRVGAFFYLSFEHPF
ncbi:MAG: transporter [Acidobacteriota bacterium]